MYLYIYGLLHWYELLTEKKQVMILIVKTVFLCDVSIRRKFHFKIQKIDHWHQDLLLELQMQCTANRGRAQRNGSYFPIQVFMLNYELRMYFPPFLHIYIEI